MRQSVKNEPHYHRIYKCATGPSVCTVDHMVQLCTRYMDRYSVECGVWGADPISGVAVPAATRPVLRRYCDGVGPWASVVHCPRQCANQAAMRPS